MVRAKLIDLAVETKGQTACYIEHAIRVGAHNIYTLSVIQTGTDAEEGLFLISSLLPKDSSG